MATSDLDALRDLGERYAAGADSGDAELYCSAFLPDGVLYVHNPHDGPPTGQRVGHEQLGKVPGLLRRYDDTFHMIGNRRFELADDGRTATGFVYCIANHVTRSAGTNYVMHIRYDDEYARDAADEWRMAVRHCRVVFTETRPIDATT